MSTQLTYLSVQDWSCKKNNMFVHPATDLSIRSRLIKLEVDPPPPPPPSPFPSPQINPSRCHPFSNLAAVGARHWSACGRREGSGGASSFAPFLGLGSTVVAWMDMGSGNEGLTVSGGWCGWIRCSRRGGYGRWRRW